jgi:hypothetical protein
MLGKILKKKKPKDESGVNKELALKISKMNLTDMKAYINGRNKELPVSEEGLYEVMKRLTLPNETTQELYLKEDDMDAKKKKAFDLVIAIAGSKKLTLKTLELIPVFEETYKTIIQEYDTQHKQIYHQRIADAMKMGMNNLNQLAELKKKMALLKQH